VAFRGSIAAPSLVVMTTDAEEKCECEMRSKLWDQTRALEMLAQHFALLTDVVRMDAEKELLERLDRGRARNVEAKARRATI
jgi:hypothetical protein